MSERLLGWEDYPSPRIVLVKGKLSVEVSVPRAIRHLFGSGQGGVTNRRRSTGTTDPVLAEKKKMQLAHEIYKEFDLKQIDAEVKEAVKYDDFARTAITDLAKALKYNRSVIPRLDTATKYSDLEEMKRRLDEAVNINDDDLPERHKRISAEFQVMAEARRAGVNFDTPSLDEIKLPMHVTAISTKTNDATVQQKMKSARSAEEDVFNSKMDSLLEAYSSNIVESFWQDLLTKAAWEQKLPEPVFEGVGGVEFVAINDSFQPKNKVHSAVKMLTGRSVIFPDAKRKRQVQSVKQLRISDVREEYVAFVSEKYSKPNTRRKWIRSLDRFVEMVGNFALGDVKPLQAYQFAEAQVAINSSVSNKTITNYHAGMVLLLGYCVRKGYIDFNPLQSVSVKDYGIPSQSWLPYTSSDLKVIFDHNWSTQERMFLNIVSSTGMRATEVGSLTWERFNENTATNIRWFSLLDTLEENVAVKNEGSARYVPLHPHLKLPAKGKGRLFDYTIDGNGLCSSSVGHIILPTLNKLVNHKRKSIHSFRRTLKILMRDAEVSKEINDMYTGHGSGDASSTAYGGVSVEARFNAISKVQMPWLRQ